MWILLACTSSEPAPSTPALVSPVFKQTEASDCTPDDVQRDLALEAVLDGQADPCQLSAYIAMLDERGEHEGPWFEELWVARSPDAATIDLSTAVKLGPGAVPEVFTGPDGRIWMVYGAGDLEKAKEEARAGSAWLRNHGLAGFGTLEMMVSTDGFSFEPVEEFEVVGLVRGMVVDPDVVALPGGVWRMYYVGTPIPELLQKGAWDPGKEHSIYFAESRDLVHWTQLGEAVRGPNADPSVYIRPDSSAVMASTGIDWAESTDAGRKFTFDPREDPFGFAPELVDLGEGRVRLFYNSRVKGGALRSALSVDHARTWTDEGERLGNRLVEAVSLVEAPDGDGWLVYYHYWKPGIHGDTWGADESGGRWRSE